MASKYFTLPSFSSNTTKAQEGGVQTAPQSQPDTPKQQESMAQEPVLNEEDEKFLTRHMSTDGATDIGQDVQATKIADDGVETLATEEEAGNTAEQVVVPKTQPTDNDDLDTKDDPSNRPPLPQRQPKKRKSMDLPSQEEAEAATKIFPTSDDDTISDRPGSSSDRKRPWSSYLPSVPTLPSPPQTSSGEDPRTWTQYASSYIPTSLTSKPSPPPSETEEQQRHDLTTLLTNLNISTLNNRVFSLSAETQQLHVRFAQILKDTINGAPTAYEDMETLMREAGPKLEQQFKSLPPFVQTLVMSLPAKLGSTIGAEVLAQVDAKKPEDELKAATTTSTDEAAETTEKKEQKKAKTARIPGLKSLIASQGAVATLLRNVVSFLQTRFPFIASGTNVVLSLAVFILMFVFYYCHKRGREVRLANEGEEGEEEKEGGTESSKDFPSDEDAKDVQDAHHAVIGDDSCTQRHEQASNIGFEKASTERDADLQGREDLTAEKEARMRENVDELATTLASKDEAAHEGR